MRLLELALQGDVEIAISAAILGETLRVLRDKFLLSPDDLAEAEGYLLRCAKLVTPTETLDAVPTDLDDNRVLECAVAAGSEKIVSGDQDLLRLRTFRGIDVVQVADFLSLISTTAAST